jgi:hypothetical protein
MFYSIILIAHSLVRWLIVLSALLAIIRAITGLSFKRGWTQIDNRVGLWFTTFLDIQSCWDSCCTFSEPVDTG